jgi:hypothetical protein
MPVSISGSWNISGNASLDSVAPLTVTAGATTTVSAQQNQTLTSFNPIASVTGGYPPYTYVVSSDSRLPAGLTLNPTTGLVSGTPTTVQNSAPTVFAVRDLYGTQSANTATVNFAVQTLPVIAATGTTTPVTSFQNVAITSFSPFNSVSNGFAPYTYFVSSGTLPPGITINASTGIVSGTPTTVQAAANVIFAVKDSQNNQAATTVSISFTILNSLVVQYLVVAGGAGGGGNGGIYGTGGGGGAGGLLQGTATLTPTTIYTITVGTGGPGGPAPGVCGQCGAGGAGNPSSISGIASVTGGGSGFSGNKAYAPATANGGPGGSGGGGYTSGGSGTPGQGNSGGAGTTLGSVGLVLENHFLI